MKDFINRVALVIHWCAFLIGALFFMVGMFMGFTTPGGAEIFLTAPLVFFAIWGTGWLIRYLLVGKCKLNPWETL
ncbi:hypothetical protein N8994_01230 [Gammaproteobacteria bacterium]|nr:hypothetical protein [Gammaproteobacteria bacterium]